MPLQRVAEVQTRKACSKGRWQAFAAYVVVVTTLLQKVQLVSESLDDFVIIHSHNSALAHAIAPRAHCLLICTVWK
jgi:hypothetical protein